MTEIRAVEAVDGANLAETGVSAALRGLAERLHFAAAPTLALMAVLTALHESPIDEICSAASGGSLNGMVVMYVLMSAFHVPPWLKLIFGARGVVGP
jgi:hypothetical protein